MKSQSLPQCIQKQAAQLLPLTAAEMTARGWDEVDVVFVTGDAYVDHPSFAMAILGRVLEAAGFRVAMLSQPDWQILRALAAVRPAAAVLRHQRRQHGFADQSLHRQQEGPQRRRLFARRPHRPAARSGHAALLPAGPRGVSRACPSSPAASRPRCADWPITITGATPSAGRSCSTAKADLRGLRHGRAPIVEIARRLAAGQTVERSARHCAAWPMPWASESAQLQELDDHRRRLRVRTAFGFQVMSR